MRLFPESMKLTQGNKLESITLRGWPGGWNAVASDIAMDPKFLSRCVNFHRTPTGTQVLRHGNGWFADVADVVNGDILDSEYFNGRGIIVTDAGEICTVDDDGNKVAIWNEAIANALPSAPNGWSGGLTSIDFVPFKTELVIHNGVDKPVTIDSDFDVTYLQDLATGSNVNVPIGKYGCVVSNFHVVAGIEDEPTLVYVTSEGTSGTFPGDPIPNNAISFDVGAYAPEGASAIRGIAGFRTFLLIFFQGQAIVVKLGEFNDADVHVPRFPDTLPPRSGLIGHRSIIGWGEDKDLVYGGFDGIGSAKRTLFSDEAVEGDKLSDLIEPDYRGGIGTLSENQRLLNSFMLYDPLGHRIMQYIPNGNEDNGRMFVYSANDKLKYKSWSEYATPTWTCGFTSFLGRLFLCQGTRIYLNGNDVFENENFYADMENDRDSTWANAESYGIGELVYDPDDETVYECLVIHLSGTGTFAEDREENPTFWEEYLGEPIDFEFELPWLDGKDPMKVKQLRFIAAATKGTAEFTVSAYVDNLYKNHAGEIVHDPALALTLIGNDAQGFGFDDGPYGGGRRSNDPRLMSFPLKFKTLKLVIDGSTRKPLELANLSFLFSRGKYKR